jgi:GNAT superfamily N-acetyltransferase
MAAQVRYRFMVPGEEGCVCDLVCRVFDECIAPEYEANGVREFHDYVYPEGLAARAAQGHFVLLAEARGELVGALEVRDHQHVSLLFVDKKLQRRGIARSLLKAAVGICLMGAPGVRELTVNSSPNSVPAYERLGFTATGPEETVNGIRFVPMVLALPVPVAA